MRRTLNRKQIDSIFENSSHQSEVCTALYRLAFPEWDELQSIEGWPAIGKEAGLYITRRYMEFDRKHHPDVLNGGLWMNKRVLNSRGCRYGTGPVGVVHRQLHHLKGYSAMITYLYTEHGRKRLAIDSEELDRQIAWLHEQPMCDENEGIWNLLESIRDLGESRASKTS